MLLVEPHRAVKIVQAQTDGGKLMGAVVHHVLAA